MNRTKNTKRTKKEKTDSVDIFKKLLIMGRKKEYLTYEEINNFLPEEIISAEQIERVFSVLDNEKIAIVDSEAEFNAQKKDRGGNGKHNHDSNKQHNRGVLSEAVYAGIEDPVKMYLRQMGQIPLLSREDEIRLAQEIEKAEEEYKSTVLKCPYVKDSVLSLANNILSRNLNIEDVIKEESKVKKE